MKTSSCLTSELENLEFDLRPTSELFSAGRFVRATERWGGLNLVYKLRQQYFNFYDSNAQYLGHVKDHELRTSIVRTYTLAKGLIDSHLINNDLLQQYNAISALDVRSYSVGFARACRSLHLTL
jgi:hypothetical protein